MITKLGKEIVDRSAVNYTNKLLENIKRTATSSAERRASIIRGTKIGAGLGAAGTLLGTGYAASKYLRDK